MTVTDRCGKDPDCKDAPSHTIEFRCRATLRNDVLEIVDDPTRFHSNDTDQTLPPKLGACAARAASTSWRSDPGTSICAAYFRGPFIVSAR